MRVQMKLAPIAAKSQSEQLGRATNWTIGPRFRLVGRSIWRPLQGASLLVDDPRGETLVETLG